MQKNIYFTFVLIDIMVFDITQKLREPSVMPNLPTDLHNEHCSQHNCCWLEALRFCQFDQNFGNSPSLYFWLWLGNDWLHVFLLIPPFLLLAASTNSSTLWKSLAPGKATMDNLKGFFLWTLTFKVRLVNGTLCYEMS